MASILSSSRSPTHKSPSSPAIHLRPHPFHRPPAFRLGRYTIELPTSIRQLSPRALLVPFVVVFLLLYSFAGSSERELVRVQAAQEGLRVHSVLGQLKAGNFTLDSLPLTHSETLNPYLVQLDTLFKDAYRDHPPLKDETYQPPVFAPSMSPAQFHRFAHLLPSHSDERFLFTSVLLNVAPITPDLFSTLVALVDFLGPHRFGLSIVEGPSNDETDYLLLNVLTPVLLSMGVRQETIYLSLGRPSADFSNHNRIDVLAKLREEAIAPLRRHKDEGWGTVVFFNDVYWSLSMGLEMIGQHANQDGDMTCAWDLLWGNECVPSRSSRNLARCSEEIAGHRRAGS